MGWKRPCHRWLGAVFGGVLALAAPARAGEVERNIETLVGRIAAELLAREYGTLDNPLLTDWVDRVGQRVAAVCPRQEFPYRFRILDAPESNAYALPGARIFVTRGLLAHVASEDELAGVMAHEIGHVGDRDFQRVVARQLLYLGLGTLAERLDEEEFQTPVAVVQLLDTLRASRGQEDEADRRAVEYALAARYDPVAYMGFMEIVLGPRAKPREWYENLLETHPDAFLRRQRCLERSQRLKRESPDALAALADDLLDRGRLGAALENYRVLQAERPDNPRGGVGEARILLLRGDPEGCKRKCREALAVAPDDREALALLREAEATPPPEPAPTVPAPSERAAVSAKLDRQALARLRNLSRQLSENREFDDVLTWAQVYQPEAGDWRWLVLLARARLLVMATDRLRWRVGEIAGLADAGSRAWDELSASGAPCGAEEALMWYNAGVRDGASAARELVTTMTLLPPLLASLVLTGRAEPLGRMSSSRFALMEMDLLCAEVHVRRALDRCRTGARDVARAEGCRLAVEIDGLARRARPHQVRIYHTLAGARLGLGPERVASLTHEHNGLGSGCRYALAERAGVGVGDVDYEQAEAVRLVMRLLRVELGVETLERDSQDQSGAAA